MRLPESKLAVHTAAYALGLRWRRVRARPGQLVAAVAGLDQRVGAEAQAGLGRDDVVDHSRVVPRVEVVDELGALVAEEPGVLEARRSLHDARR